MKGSAVGWITEALKWLFHRNDGARASFGELSDGWKTYADTVVARLIVIEAKLEDCEINCAKRDLQLRHAEHELASAKADVDKAERKIGNLEARVIVLETRLRRTMEAG